MAYKQIDIEHLSVEERQELFKTISGDEELKELLSKIEGEYEEEENYETELGAILAGTGENCKGGYPLGKGFLPPAPAGTLGLLTMLKSPLVGLQEEGDEVDPMTFIRAVYVIGKGKEAVKPVMGLSSRLHNLMRLRKFYTSPSQEQTFLEKIDNVVHKAYTELDGNALDYLEETYGAVAPDSIYVAVMACLMDAIGGLEMLPNAPTITEEERAKLEAMQKSNGIIEEVPEDIKKNEVMTPSGLAIG